MRYERRAHAAKSTDDFTFHQLIPYIGNKRKLLHVIGRALAGTGVDPARATFLDLFAGSGVVSRHAKRLGFRVLANDWEPYSEVLCRAAIEANAAPRFHGGRSYEEVIAALNALPPREGWVTTHLCPPDDEAFDVTRDRMFYMRKNGMRLDAIREQIATWESAGTLTPVQRDCLIAPLLYQASYTSNTSGVFKGFHRGWGGSTGTALHRIAGDVQLRPAVFHDNGRENRVFRLDATALAAQLAALGERPDVAYVDPPYNQHPYGSNYHVLTSIALWDKPALSPTITGRGDKSAIRDDWRTLRRSAYNHRALALAEYRRLLAALDVPWIVTSYSTDGSIPAYELVRANLERGETRIILEGYKRYRVSSQRFSSKPMNVEFVLVTETWRPAATSVERIVHAIEAAERSVLSAHPESAVDFA